MPMIYICIYMHHEILFSHKKNEIFSDLVQQHEWTLNIMLNGMSNRIGQILYDSIHMLALKHKWTNKTYTYREQIGGCLKGGWLRGG